MNKTNFLKILTVLFLMFFAVPTRVFADGKDLFDKNCKKCHGDDGTGKKDGEWLKVVKILKIEKNPEVLNILSDDAKKLKDDEMVKIVLEGKEEKDKAKMKGLKDKVSEADAKEIIAYVRTLQAKAK